MEKPIKKKYLDGQETLACLEERGIKRSKAWLERGRWAGTGPRFCRIAGRCCSTEEWIDEYLLDCENGREAQK